MRLRVLLVIFTFSGFAGLVFEVGLQRELTRAFGVSAWATSTVLAAYMAGLALGSWFFGNLADKHSSPLKLYGYFEAGVALYAALTPQISRASVALFAHLAHGAEPDAGALALLRLVMSFAITLVPTLLMGGTLPALAKVVATHQGSSQLSGKSVARLYTANTLGAALGAAVGTYALLPQLGLSLTLRTGAALNLLAAGFAFYLATRANPSAARESMPEPTADMTSEPIRKLDVRLLMAGAAWSGLCTFAYEVTWTQLLAIVVGNSVYAFGLMAAIFLVGLALGAAWAARLPEERLTLAMLGRVQLAASAVVVLILPQWQRVSVLFEILEPFVTSFAGRELVRALVCVDLMLLPAAFLGAFYPLLLRAAARAGAVGHTVGQLGAVNTLGAVLGSLLTGFVLLPLLGTHGLLVALIVAGCGVALVALRGEVNQMAMAGAVALVALLIPGWDLSQLASGSNVYFFRPEFTIGEVIWSRESVASGLTTVVSKPKNIKVLLTNGKFQGSNEGEVAAQRAFAQVPMLFNHGYDRALLIGVGTGCSLGVLGAEPFREVEAVDLARDVVSAAREHFGDVNGHVLDGNRIKMIYSDGRNRLLLTDEKYDTVTIELTSIWFAGAADLYNRESYALIGQHLAPHGVLQQWVQLHHMSRHDLAIILNTARHELPHVQLYAVGGQGQLIASQEPLEINYEQLGKLSAKLSGSAATAGLPGGDLLTLADSLLLDEAGVAELIHEEATKAGVPEDQFISTDDNLFLEYSTPKSNVPSIGLGQDLVQSIGALIDKHVTVVVGAEQGGPQEHLKAASLVAQKRFDEAKPVLENAVAHGAWAAPLLQALNTRPAQVANP
jgi:spermidine synthase